MEQFLEKKKTNKPSNIISSSELSFAQQYLENKVYQPPAIVASPEPSVIAQFLENMKKNNSLDKLPKPNLEHIQFAPSLDIYMDSVNHPENNLTKSKFKNIYSNLFMLCLNYVSRNVVFII